MSYNVILKQGEFETWASFIAQLGQNPEGPTQFDRTQFAVERDKNGKPEQKQTNPGK